jgi:hypothetical protein
MKLIDFDRARIVWQTHDGSHGLWRIVATARREPDGEAWYLAPGVMAGDVYGQGRLPLQPPYSFQVIASREKHVMLREAVDAASVQDTVAPHADTFSRLIIDAPEIDAELAAPAAAKERWPLAARVSVAGVSGVRWTLEFPVAHINLRDEPPAWQVETGPIIAPSALIDIAGAAKPGGLQLAFAFFSRPDQLDLLAFGPLGSGRRAFRHFAQLNDAAISLFA